MNYTYESDTVGFDLEAAQREVGPAGNVLNTCSQGLAKLVTSLEDMQKDVNDKTGTYVADDYVSFAAAVEHINGLLKLLDDILENFDNYITNEINTTRR